MFNRIYQALLITEGGYVHNPADRGGETFCGISRKYWPGWSGWPMVDSHLQSGGLPSQLRDIPSLAAQVRRFYLIVYWNDLKCDQLPEAIAAELFDSAVNCGSVRAAKWLQHAINLFANQDILVEDGVIGEKTVAKARVQVENFGHGHLLKALNGQQYMHYQQLVENDQSQKVFLRGWLTRVWEDHSKKGLS